MPETPAQQTATDVTGLCLTELAALATAPVSPRGKLVPRSIDILPEHPRTRGWRLRRRSERNPARLKPAMQMPTIASSKTDVTTLRNRAERGYETGGLALARGTSTGRGERSVRTVPVAVVTSP